MHGSPLISIFLIAFASSCPFAHIVDWLIWLPTFAAAWFLLPLPHREGPGEGFFRRLKQSPTLRRLPSTTRRPPAAGQRVLQQLTRTELADGRHTIHATLTALFAPGQRTATLYVAFCPPFERLPEVDVDFDDATIATVKLTQLLHHGAQLDVSLSRPAITTFSGPVELFALQSREGEASAEPS